MISDDMVKRMAELDKECKSAELVRRFERYFAQGIVLVPNVAGFRRFSRQDKIECIADLDSRYRS